MVFMLRRMNGGWEKLQSTLFFSPASKFSVCRFNNFFSALSHFSFLKAKPFGSFPQSFHWVSSVSPSVTVFCQGAPLALCPQMSRPLVAGTPLLLSSPTQPICVSFKQVQALPGRSWFQDSPIGLSRVLLSGWSRHFFVRNNLYLFSTSQILSFSFAFGIKFHQALKPGFIQ